MRIIEDEDVAVVQIPIGGGFFNHGLDRKGHHTDKNRKTGFSLDQRVPGLRVIKAVAGIMRFSNDGIERCAEERCVHFVRNLFHAAG
jgi:hypothetical protein